MNARMYDPILGRMLAPDNYIMGGTQGYNRYTYALNNPLKFTDPSGNWANFAMGAVVGAFSGYVMGSKSGASGMNMAMYVVGGAILGAMTSGVGSAVSGGVAGAMGSYSGTVVGGAITGASSGAAAGFVGGFYGSAVVGGDPWQAGVRGAAWGAASGAVFGGVGAIGNKSRAYRWRRGGSESRSMAGGELNTSTKELLLKDAAEWNASADQQAATDLLKRRFMKVTPELEWMSKRLGLKELTTQVPIDLDPVWGYDKDTKLFVRLSDGNYATAITRQIDGVDKSYLFVSPNVVLNYSDVRFGGIMKHEMTHVWQYSIIDGMYMSEIQKESPAYLSHTQYLLSNGNFYDAYNLHLSVLGYGYNGMSKWYLYFPY